MLMLTDRRLTVYRLPTVSARKYRGKYPRRVCQWSASGTTCHVETNDGQRYVFHGRALDPSGSLSRNGSSFEDALRTSAKFEDMSLADYCGVLFVILTIRKLRSK